jgi:RNA polymerase sigma-70 factor (ECF subfamily)
VLLADADRGRWDRELVRRGLLLTRAALAGSRAHPGPMALQAAIAAEHAIAPSLGATNWRRVVDLYGALLSVEPSPTLALARSVALAQLSGPAAGLRDLGEVLAMGGLERYPYAHAARASLLDALGRRVEARAAWASAAELARTDAERTFFAHRAG